VSYFLVVEEDRSCVISVTSTPLHIARPNASSPSAHHRTNTGLGLLKCGTPAQPWLLEAPTGQKIHLSVLDFSPMVVSSVATVSRLHESTRVPTINSRLSGDRCVDQHRKREYGFIVDKPATGNKRNISICVAATGSQRLTNVYTSSSNTVELVLMSTDQYLASHSLNFLLRFEGRSAIIIAITPSK